MDKLDQYLTIRAISLMVAIFCIICFGIAMIFLPDPSMYDFPKISPLNQHVKIFFGLAFLFSIACSAKKSIDIHIYLQNQTDDILNKILSNPEYKRCHQSVKNILDARKNISNITEKDDIKFTVLYTPQDTVQAGMIRCALENAGITCYVENENFASTRFGGGTCIGMASICIMVPASRLEEARNIIRELGFK